jgi:hypothetical protein
MPTAYIDRVDTLEMVERHGTVRSLTRKALIGFGRADLIPADFSVLTAALDALPAALTPFRNLSNDPTLFPETTYSALVLTERSPKLHQNDPAWVEVTLKYEHILDGPNQQLYKPRTGILFGKGKCSVVEKTTNFYVPRGVKRNKKNRVMIEVAHTYKSQDSGIVAFTANLPNKELFPMTVLQGGEVNVPFPQANFKLQGTMNTDNPWFIGRKFIARINSVRWLGMDVHTWLCSEVTWDALDTVGLGGDTPAYHFEFEFQYNEDTWDPTVVFLDQRTGRPPADVERGYLNNPHLPAGAQEVLSHVQNPISLVGVQPAGMWDVPCLEEINFTEAFNAYFEGLEGVGFN